MKRPQDAKCVGAGHDRIGSKHVVSNNSGETKQTKLYAVKASRTIYDCSRYIKTPTKSKYIYVCM